MPVILVGVSSWCHLLMVVISTVFFAFNDSFYVLMGGPAKWLIVWGVIVP
jgi:hypothetical protein